MSEYAMDDLLPHRAPMQLVDGIKQDGAAIIVTASITPDNLFAGSDGVPAWVASEMMAQAIAAQTSLQAKLANTGDGVRGGMLLAVKRFKASQAVMPFGTVLSLTCEAVSDDGPMKLYRCQADSAQFSASAMLSVIQTAEQS